MKLVYVVIDAVTLAFLSLGCLAAPETPATPLDNIISASLMVEVMDGSGSGVAVKNGDITYVWTAAHVVEDEKSIKQVFDVGTKSYVPKVSFADVKLIQEDYEGDRKVGETFAIAKVVRYSERHDIAVLRSYKSRWPAAGVTFLDGPAPRAGTALWHVGSMKGRRGMNSVSAGIFSAAGRLRLHFKPNEAEGLIYDQASISAYPGSSGGGVFLQESGKCVGIITEFLGQGITPGELFMVPARRVRSFAKEYKCLWALGEAAVPEDEGAAFCDDILKPESKAIEPPVVVPLPLPITLPPLP